MTIKELYDYAKLHNAENLEIKLDDGQSKCSLQHFLTYYLTMEVERDDNGRLTGNTKRVFLKK